MQYTKYRILTSGKYKLDLEKYNVLWVNENGVGIIACEYKILFTLKPKEAKAFIRQNLLQPYQAYELNN